MAAIRVHRGPRADGRWYWKADRPDGHSGRVHVWSGWGTPDEAQAAVVATLGGVTQRPDGATVRDLLETWGAAMDARADLAQKSKENAEIVSNRLLAILGGVLLDRLDRRTLERYRDQRQRTGRASTVRLDLRILRQAWQWGREVGIAPERDLPLVQVRPRPDEPTSKRTPDTEDVLRVLDELLPAGRRRAEWPARAAWLLLATGCRIGEVATLTRGAVDLERGELHVRGKTGSRVVPLLAETVAELRTWDLPSDPQAPVWGVSYATMRTGLPMRLRSACKRAGVPAWTPHALRRHAVDALYRRGIDPTVAAALLGHSPAVAMAYYRQAASGDLREAMERVKLGAMPRDNVRKFGGGEDPT